MKYTSYGLLLITMVLCEDTVLASFSAVTFKKLANQYLTCPVSSQMYSSSAVSAMECTLMCNKETNCMSVNYDRLGSTCELLSVSPFQASVSSAVNTEWTVYHKHVSCNGDWVIHGLHCYLYNTDMKTWEQARQHCLAMGANLVYIDDDAENAFVWELAKSHSDSLFWIGLSDIEAEDVWIWSSGSTSTYRYFADGEPNNSNNNEHCVSSLWNDAFQWNDAPCTDSFPSVCKLTIGK